MIDLESLLGEWQAAEPRRALGGLYALAGFNYQARVVLADLVERLVQGGDGLAAANEVFSEALSDLLRIESDGLVCVQIKRTLTKETLKKAGEEIEAIQAFLGEHAPELTRTVRFEVVASQGPAQDWAEVADQPDSSSVLRMLYGEGRLQGPRLDPDPWWRLISLTWGILDDPFAFARFALDQILAQGRQPGDPARVRDSIAEEFTRRRTTPALLGRIYRPEDFDPPAAPPSRLAIGRLVTPERLREGQYWRRERDVATLLHAVEQHRLTQIAGHQEQVTVVWLQGRSGSGKSVLLVQLLEQLVRTGRRTIWLGSDVARLEELLRQVAAEPADRAPELVLVDDLYDPEARDELDLLKLGRFLETQSGRTWPLIVTCGPPEFATSFLADSRHRGFTIEFLEMPTANAADARDLATWYWERYGRSAPEGPAFDQAKHGKGLMVSMAVELEYGDLKQFAARFADRLAANDLSEAMRLPLALGRLYIWSPETWFDEDVRERLENLAISGDLSLEAAAVGRRYVRLTHPHLAAAIYDAIRIGATPLARANDLAAAFERAVESRDGHFLRRLLWSFCPPAGSLVASRLEDVNLERLILRCAEAWHSVSDQSVYLRTADESADLAVSWACLDARITGLGKVLGIARPVEEALQRLTEAQSFWPALWSRLADEYPGDARVERWAREAVAHPQRQRHPQWSRVWERCAPPSDTSAPWLSAGQTWIERSVDPPDWHFVWRRLLAEESAKAWAIDAGLARLRESPDRPEWAFVTQDLLGVFEKRNDLLAVQGLVRQSGGWLDGREDRPDWTYVWQILVEQRNSLPDDIRLTNLLRRGWSWLDGREDRPEWAFVWRLLVEQRNSLPDDIRLTNLLRRGWSWLDGREDRPEWT
ncbi:MAG: adenylyl-sulfate kinase, partial [Acidobacteria bacterium]|nr:adenylyl-sulfate kinase [Acidobacteriota bacterium]